MSAIAAFPQLVNNPVLEQINALRARMGLPPMSESEFMRLRGGSEATSQPTAPWPAGSPQAQPIPAAATGLLPSPSPAVSASRPVAPQQAVPQPVAQPAVQPAPQATPQPDQVDAIIGQLSQYFDPGAQQPDRKRIPPVEVTSEFGDEPVTDTGKFGDPFGGGFGRGPGLAINKARLDQQFGRERLPATPGGRRLYTVTVGRQTVGRFESQEQANAVRDEIRNRLGQGPVPATPRLGLYSGKVSFKDPDLDELLFGLSPRGQIEREGQRTLQDIRRAELEIFKPGRLDVAQRGVGEREREGQRREGRFGRAQTEKERAKGVEEQRKAQELDFRKQTAADRLSIQKDELARRQERDKQLKKQAEDLAQLRRDMLTERQALRPLKEKTAADARNRKALKANLDRAVQYYQILKREEIQIRAILGSGDPLDDYSDSRLRIRLMGVLDDLRKAETAYTEARDLEDEFFQSQRADLSNLGAP